MENKRVVSWSKEKGIATIIIDNPPVNVLSYAVVEQMTAVVDEIERDDEVIVVLLTGAGEKAFVAGGDIKSFPGWIGKGSEYAEEKALWLQNPLNKIERLSKPVIAAINGLALGGGCELALSCDLRIIEEHTQIGLPEVKLGLFPGAGGTQRLPRLIGTARAKEMMFTGEPLSAEEALQVGLVNHVVPRGEALNKAKEQAAKMARFSLPALSLMKQSINKGLSYSLEEGLKIEAKNFGRVFQTSDVKEGVEAFIEKRVPLFHHK
ncbi:enoyl-CoA hydratase [Bacillus pseudomycoides]|uniref:enoyl-CoA hydratase n=1 Tax=Bacillus pseudomycoides TaxID=64104 RepID=UPI000BECA449|nr:enoyl-CoA hydratase [Bacillus pseudomycoides]PED07221.1 enoyl-CoA hydratase [Bacillus pseudomycoides]PEK11470.1 enoyl-CoA hydratase [Bacillus pseudomycoides]PEO21561.1 enoyl-CoA hydratase [Bacillus pseudomycoides]PEP68292.1 enoyl-CoA hydratase [Bacillus pseudomycoides]PFW69196.1 enoyl-CoA hydratase [Bacillus pseudomycoides]